MKLAVAGRVFFFLLVAPCAYWRMSVSGRIVQTPPDAPIVVARK
jgi:hypothetical protein